VIFISLFFFFVKFSSVSNQVWCLLINFYLLFSSLPPVNFPHALPTGRHLESFSQLTPSIVEKRQLKRCAGSRKA